MFSSEIFFFLFDFNTNNLEHFVGLFNVSFHDGSGDLDDGVHDEVAEGSLKGFSADGGFGLLPFLVFSIKVVVSPKSFHHLGLVGLELVGVDSGKSGKGKGILIFSGSESNITSEKIIFYK
jgi:hypothetical protein